METESTVMIYSELDYSNESDYFNNSLNLTTELPEDIGNLPRRLDDLVIVPVIWGSLILLGTLGNGLVLYVMLRHAEAKTTNCYVINLALSDLLFLSVVTPFTMMHYILPEWIFGVHMCRFVMYTVFVTLLATCLTLTAMSIDRYFAIIHPISSIQHRTPTVAKMVSAQIWIVAFLVNIPFAVYHGLVPYDYFGERHYCRAIWPSKMISKVALTCVVCVTYVIPLAIISVCYSRIIRHLWTSGIQVNVQGPLTRSTVADVTARSAHIHHRKRKKATKLVAVVVVLFATFWLPIHVFHLWTEYDDNFPKTDEMYMYKIFAHALSYANSCVNPFVYSFLGDGFRKGVRRAFPYFFGTNSVAVTPRPINTSRQDEHVATSSLIMNTRNRQTPMDMSCGTNEKLDAGTLDRPKHREPFRPRPARIGGRRQQYYE